MSIYTTPLEGIKAEDMIGHVFSPGFINPIDGIHWREIRREGKSKKAIYRVTVDDICPFTFVSADGSWRRPDKTFDSDLGSVPSGLRWFCDKDRFKGFFGHDSNYVHGGFWISRDLGRTWTFVENTKVDADRNLREEIIYDPYPGTLIQACLIYAAVKYFGKGVWNRGDLRKRIDHDR